MSSEHCILVELRPDLSLGLPLLFTSAAAFRNQDFVEASTVERTLRIDLRGLDGTVPLPRTPEVVFAVRTQNLPLPGDVPFTLPVDEMERVRFEVEQGTFPLLPREYVQPEPGSGAYRIDPLDEALSSIWPTLEIQPFVRTEDFTGAQEPNFEALVPFRLYIRHEGPLFGFAFSLSSRSGNSLLELPLDEFDDLTAQVTLTVSAIESATQTFTASIDEPPVSIPEPACSLPLEGTRRMSVRAPGFAVVLLALAALSARRETRPSTV